jgi:spermidine synthase
MVCMGTQRIELLGDADRPGAWMLLVGGVTQSHVDLDDPRHLELEYMRRLGHVADLAAPAGAPLRVLHLGGGGLTLARYVAATRPGSCQVAVESDAEMAGLVQRRLPIAAPHAGQISVRVADARAALEQFPASSFDVLVCDVFAGAQTPGHVTSAEFTAMAASVLAPSGIYAVNVGDGPAGDGPPLAHARARAASVRSVFAHACVIAEPAVLRGRRFGNLVIAAAGRELPVSQLIRRTAADPFPARVVEGGALAQFIAEAEPIMDAHAGPSPPVPPEVFA